MRKNETRDCDCGQPRWSDLSACYACLKHRAGLFGYPNGHKLTEAEKFHVGLLPTWEPDPAVGVTTDWTSAEELLAAWEARDALEHERYARGLRWLAELGDGEERLGL